MMQGWDVDTGSLGFSREGKIGGLRAGAFSHSAYRLAVIRASETGTVRLWNVSTGKEDAVLTTKATDIHGFLVHRFIIWRQW
jgi:WD40 repeat protein